MGQVFLFGAPTLCLHKWLNTNPKLHLHRHFDYLSIHNGIRAQ
ncbi:hypothetical protein HanPSC8_Chr17g0756051 [Helianthus annuus]|nr:hypothetical protein HanPSC8_Chr17g0756051 [Helianthus annuus]